MLSVARGYDWRYLTAQTTKSAENYYVSAVEHGEPPGRWSGRGAERLGLSGEVAERDMEAVYGHLADPRTGERLGPKERAYKPLQERLDAALAKEPEATPERRREIELGVRRSQQQNLLFLDVTYSVQKSVSTLHASFERAATLAAEAGDEAAAAEWTRKAQVVREAVWAGNEAHVDLLTREAGFARAGYHGQLKNGETVGQFIDAHEWIVASFEHSTSRCQEPQLHMHNAIANRQMSEDGKWRTLDSRAIHRVRAAAGAVAERTTEEYLRRELGLDFRMRPDGMAREVVGVDQAARDVFSSRRRAITAQVAEIAQAWEQQYGTAPSALQLSRISLWATLDSRPAKAKTQPSREELVASWAEFLEREAGQTLDEIATRALAAGAERQLLGEVFSPTAVITQAVAEVQASKAEWNRYDLMRALNAALPDSLGGLTGRQIEELLTDLTDTTFSPDGPVDVVQLTADEVVRTPEALRREDGQSIYERHGRNRYATREALAAEGRMVAATQHDTGPAMAPEHVDELLAGRGLGADQAAAVRGVLTSPAAAHVLIGPAGTGKSFTVGTLTSIWAEHRGPVIGLALSQQAAHVLAEEGLDRTANITQWLLRQQRLEDGRGSIADHQFALRPGALVVVDEAGMADRDSLDAIRAHCRRAGARLLLTGDDRQLGAVGAGGVLRLMAQDAGTVHQLTEVRRFHAEWEREASLRLREGDVSALLDYDTRGRLLDGGTAAEAAEAASRAWLADTIAGKRAVLVVNTNEDAAELSSQIRAELVRLGRVETEGVALEDTTVAGAGDLIQTRKNEQQLVDAVGRAVTNRDVYQVIARQEDGSLTVRRELDRDEQGALTWGPDLELPANYVREHVTLAYAGTVHSVQGSTVDVAHSLVDDRTSAEALYVAMTRGRDRNTAWIATRADEDRVDAPAEAADMLGEDRDPMAVLASILERSEPVHSATEVQREELEQSRSLAYVGHIWADLVEQDARRRYEDALGDLLPPDLYEDTTGDEAVGPLWRLLRTAELAGHDPVRVLADAVAERELVTARQKAAVLHARIADGLSGRLTPGVQSFTDRSPDVAGEVGDYVRDLAAYLDSRSGMLGEAVAAEEPAWAVERFGPVPSEGSEERAAWVRRAAAVAAYREQYGTGAVWLDQAPDAIGVCPPVGQSEARTGWHAAWQALGAPEPGRDLAELSTAELRKRIAAYEREEQWAPAHVADELRGYSLEARQWTEQATLTAAAADVEDDPERRAALRTEVEGYRALATQYSEAIAQVAYVDATRAAWYELTAEARDAAAAARTELARRGEPLQVEQDDATTAEEHLRGAAADLDPAGASANEPAGAETAATIQRLLIEARQRARLHALPSRDDVNTEVATLTAAQREALAEAAGHRRQAEQVAAELAAGESPAAAGTLAEREKLARTVSAIETWGTARAELAAAEEQLRAIRQREREIADRLNTKGLFGVRGITGRARAELEAEQAQLAEQRREALTTLGHLRGRADQAQRAAGNPATYDRVAAEYHDEDRWTTALEEARATDEWRVAHHERLAQQQQARAEAVARELERTQLVAEYLDDLYAEATAPESAEVVAQLAAEAQQRAAELAREAAEREEATAADHGREEPPATVLDDAAPIEQARQQEETDAEIGAAAASDEAGRDEDQEQADPRTAAPPAAHQAPAVARDEPAVIRTDAEQEQAATPAQPPTAAQLAAQAFPASARDALAERQARLREQVEQASSAEERITRRRAAALQTDMPIAEIRGGTDAEPTGQAERARKPDPTDLDRARQAAEEMVARHRAQQEQRAERARDTSDGIARGQDDRRHRSQDRDRGGPDLSR